MSLLVHWIVLAVALWVASTVVPGVSVVVVVGAPHRRRRARAWSTPWSGR